MEIDRFNLDFNKTHNFFKKNLYKTNQLSSSLLEIVNFNSGIFFTILPKENKIEKIHQFKYGGIAKEVINQIRSFLFGKLLLESKISCVFDNVNAIYGDEREDFEYPLFQNYGFIMKKEVYYFLKSKDASLETINDCFNMSDAFWHSLCIFTCIDFKIPDNKELLKDSLVDICNDTQLIILGAYDGEGYIFWEKTK